EAGRSSRAQGEGSTAEEAPEPPPAAAPAAARPKKLEGAIYLATSLTTQTREGELIVAITGLPMPRAMTQPCEREPLFAIPLQVDHVHQLIQLLIDKSQEADWHLPVNLPWLESPSEPQATTLGLLH